MTRYDDHVQYDAHIPYGGYRDYVRINNISADNIKLSNKLILDTKLSNKLVDRRTQEVVYMRGYYKIKAGMPMGLLLSLTYPIDQDGEPRT